MSAHKFKAHSIHWDKRKVVVGERTPISSSDNRIELLAYPK